MNRRTRTVEEVVKEGEGNSREKTRRRNVTRNPPFTKAVCERERERRGIRCNGRRERM